MLSLEKRFERALKNLSVKSEVVENLPAVVFYDDDARQTDPMRNYSDVKPFSIGLHAVQHGIIEESGQVHLSNIISTDGGNPGDFDECLEEILIGDDIHWKLFGLNFQDGMVFLEFAHEKGDQALACLHEDVISCVLSFEQSIEKTYVLVREDLGNNTQRHTVYLLAGDRITKSWQNATNKPLEWALREYE